MLQNGKTWLVISLGTVGNRLLAPLFRARCGRETLAVTHEDIARLRLRDQ